MKRKSNELSEFWSILDIDGKIIDTYVWESKHEYLFIKMDKETLLLHKNYDKNWRDNCIMVVNQPSWFQDLGANENTIYTSLSKSI